MKLRIFLPACLLALPFPAAGDPPAINPNIGHTHHHAQHGKLPT